ncbi:MAG TPA: bifunctional demethylmenaquinone methyltransferase/2-methoxy-6-polyprenyl-1,4-benzoquinol methylase UbiE [Anaerolineales bacterium]|nr:bifunctional demethylmenaquinone methyltransferase/2-methoxy-6-polyprenyl-1,4-benzoquinol methylase UbiE [Anaerolineales bacterium]
MATDTENTSGVDQAQYVQDMFSRIAKRYDLMNRLMTAGQDTRWRREVIRRSQLEADGRLLDLGTGTGDLAREAARQVPDCSAVAADFTLEMMRVGKSRTPNLKLQWTAADALCLPFPGETFEAVVSGFLLRNVTDIKQSLREQLRVLKPGGYLVALDTTRPAENNMRVLIDFYLHVIIPSLGRMVTGEAEAYTYLPETTEAFLEAEQLADYMEHAGFQEVDYRRLMFGTIAIHWGKK